MNFYALRVSLVASEPQLFVNGNMSKDIYAFENALRYAVESPPKNEHGEILYSLSLIIDGKEQWLEL